MLEPGRSQQRVNIPFFEGINSLVSFNIGKKTELLHAENARSKMVGTIEKREGQTVLGTNISYKPFVTTKNYGLFSFQNKLNQGLYRISVNENSTLSVNVSDNLMVSETFNDPNVLSVLAYDSIGITENVNDHTGDLVTMYYLDSSNRWIPLTGNGTNIPGGVFDYTYAEGCVFMSNLNSENRYIDEDGITVITSTSASGHLFNTPKASRINYYKNRLYLADFIQKGIRYKTTVLRSSYPMGIISLLSADRAPASTGTVTTNATKTLIGDGTKFTSTFHVGDSITVSGETVRTIATINSDTSLTVTSAFSSSLSGLTYTTNGGVLEVTDTKYFYTQSGANSYEVYRGTVFVAAITVTAISGTSITVTWSGDPSFLASDEIWIAGTYSGKKVFRWVQNPTIAGKDVKQYDTFKLSGGENDPITMLTNIGNVMLVSNKNSMSSWNDYVLENFDSEIGCISPKGYVKLRGILYFLHHTGIYTTTGGVAKLISNKIEKYITGATKTGKENCAAGKKGSSVFFTLGDVTLYKADGSVNKVLKDVCAEYNIVQENWYIHTNVKASEFATFVEETDSDRLELLDTSGNHAVKEFLSGETDDGSIIHFRIDSIKLTTQPTNFEYSSKIIALIAETERGSAIQVFVNLENQEEYYAVDGSLKKGLSVVRITDKDPSRGKPPVARLVSISLRDSSKQLCRISRMMLVYLPTTDEDANDE